MSLQTMHTSLQPRKVMRIVPVHDYARNGHYRYAPLPSDEPIVEYISTKPLAPSWREQLALVTWSYDFKDAAPWCHSKEKHS